MTKKKMIIAMASAALVLGGGAPIQQVWAEETSPTVTTSDNSVGQSQVDARLRSGEAVIEATISTDQPVSQKSQALVVLQDAQGNTVNSYTYSMKPGQQQFSVWFNLPSHKAADYTMSVKVADKDKTYSGSSVPVHFERQAKPSAPSQAKPAEQPHSPQGNTNKATTETTRPAQTSPVNSNTENHKTTTPVTKSDTPTTNSMAKDKKTPIVAEKPAKKSTVAVEDNKDKMLLDGIDEETQPSKGFPWLMASIGAVSALGIFWGLVAFFRQK